MEDTSNSSSAVWWFRDSKCWGCCSLCLVASTNSSAELVNAILPTSFRSLSASLKEEALACWMKGHNLAPPEDTATLQQKQWDDVRTALIADHLLDSAGNDEECAQLLSVSAKESGAWLCALPVSALGFCCSYNEVHQSQQNVRTQWWKWYFPWNGNDHNCNSGTRIPTQFLEWKLHPRIELLWEEFQSTTTRKKE